MFPSANYKFMRDKKGTSGVYIKKTLQAIIVSVYKEPVMAEQVTKVTTKYPHNIEMFQCATVTEKLGEYLVGVGY